MNLIDILAPMATPLSIVLIGLVLLRELRQEMRPIFVGMITGLAAQSTTNAVVFGIGLLVFVNGVATAAADEFTKLHWVGLAATAKMLAPGVSGLLGYAVAKAGMKDQPAAGPVVAAAPVVPPIPPV